MNYCTSTEYSAITVSHHSTVILDLHFETKPKKHFFFLQLDPLLLAGVNIVNIPGSGPPIFFSTQVLDNSHSLITVLQFFSVFFLVQYNYFGRVFTIYVCTILHCTRTAFFFFFHCALLDNDSKWILILFSFCKYVSESFSFMRLIQ